MINLTDKQREAVFTRDCDLLVSAAAGSGKTAVLSERILRALMNKERPALVTDFLVVTFTNAAASEMKDRIGKKIMEAASDSSLDPGIRNHLRKQLSLLGKANITTIHAFCLDVIRNNFHLLDIDPAVRVADKNEVEILKLQVAEETLEEMYAKDGVLFSEVCKWLGGNDERLVQEILDIYRFLNGFPKPLEWLCEKTEEYCPDKCGDLSESPWIKQLVSSDKELMRQLICCNEVILEAASEAGIESYAETLEEDGYQLRRYSELFSGDIEKLLGEYPVFGKMKPKPRDADAEICEYIKDRRSKIKALAETVASKYDFTKEGYISRLQAVYPKLKCLEESIKVFDRIFKEKKKKASIIDFGDFEHLALEILSDEKNGVADGLREGYSEIMIDEYQDCNQTQELIFSFINRKKDGKSSNMFMVGDIKQSIYRFRLADPDIFADKNRRYSSDGLQRKIVLNNNFRSSATILDGVNAVFEKVMNEQTGGVNYSDDEKLYFRNDCPDKSKEEKCELVLIDKNLARGKPEADEADYVAEKVLGLIEQGYKFSDIAILVRSAVNKAQNLERALKQRNIPYFSDRGNGYFESLEINILTSMLKVIDNPMQDIELVALLRSPVFKFDDNLLTAIRLEKKGPFYGALIKYATGSGDGAWKCQSFLNRLSLWRDKVLFMPVDEFIEYLISDSGLDVFASALTGGEQRCANLKLFVLQARLLQNSGFKGLFTFVNYMERLSAGGDSSEAKLLSENSNVVRIMTIHKSKGLEFPVVFLYGCDSAFNRRDLAKSIVLHKNSGIGVRFTDAKRKISYPLISHTAVKANILKDNISEEMRVLYVALTRPKEKFICTASVDDAKKFLGKFDDEKDRVFNEVNGDSNYLEWIAVAQNDENWSVSIVSPDDISLSRSEQAEEVTDTRLVDDISEIDRLFGYKYPFDKASKLPSKLSVSEIKRRREYETPGETKLYIPAISETPGFITDKEISAAERGTINHLVLKHIDIAEHNIDACVSGLVEKGLLHRDEVGTVDKEGIESFFESELGTRLSASDEVYRELSFGIHLSAEEVFPGQGYGDEKVMIQGIIDLIFVSDGKVIVVDYKTDKFLDAEKRKMYGIQLELYEKAAEKILGKKVDEKYLYLLSKKETVKF